MNCESISNMFSARLDGELSATDQLAFEQHTEQCAACAERWQGFQVSIGALQGMGVRGVSDHYVDTLVAGVLGSATGSLASTGAAGGRRFSLVSHGLSLLLGAAAAVLIFWLGDLRESATQLPANASTQVAEALPPEPQIEYVDRIEYVEKIVEHIEYVTRPAASPRALRHPILEQALTFSGTAFVAMCDAIAALPEGETSPLEILAAQDHESQDEHTLAAAETTTARNPRRRSTALPIFEYEEAVVIRREGARLTLETFGTLDEVVPALIAQINNEDPQISSLVQDQLRGIWSARTGRDWNDAPFGVEPDRGPKNTGWRRWGSRRHEADTRPDPVQEWSAWWASQGTSIAQLGI